MRRDEQRIDELLDRGFTRFGEPSGEQLASDLSRVRERLDPAVPRASMASGAELRQHPVRGWLLGSAATVVAIVIVLIATVPWPPSALATIAEGSLYVGTDRQLLQSGGAIDAGEIVRSNGGQGSVVELSDGSRIEVASRSALSFERAADGVRIRLSAGDIIVNAAKQRAGHLYVQTKDMTVSVTGTVFMVNADDAGSRVAVIEGEVRVQQGVTDKTLLPGDQVATSLAMHPAPISEEIGWSRNAEQHRALLQQSLVAAPAVQPAAVSAETRAAFETISIRLAAPGSIGARGGGPSARAGPPCSGVDLQVDPSRFAVRNIPLYGLITLAYGKECQPQVQHVGGPAWVRLDGYDLQAAVPAGSPVYTARQLRNGMAPGLQLMLQTMLADRFKLVLGREMREMSVYNLVVVAPGKLKPSADQNPQERVIVPGAVPMFKPLAGVVGPAVSLSSAPMSKIVGLLQNLADRPVIDRTELTGLFDFVVDWPALTGMFGPELEFAMRDQLSSRLQERAGLKLEPARALVEVLVIERAERPTQN